MRVAFETGMYPIDQGSALEWTRVQNSSPRGLILLPPLIGGDLTQQISMFRWLARRGYDLLSFNYSGHGGSPDKFSLRMSLRDTLMMLQHASMLSKQEQLPLLGIASCYSAIPLINAAYRLKEPLGGLVLINAVLKLSPEAVFRSFWEYYRTRRPTQIGPRKMLAAIVHYADFLFPGIKKGKEFFGLLERKRVRLLQTLVDFCTVDPLKKVCLQNTRVLCLYAGQDRILDIYDDGRRITYQNTVRRICPLTCFRPLNGNHFLSLQAAREKASQHITTFLQDLSKNRCIGGDSKN